MPWKMPSMDDLPLPRPRGFRVPFAVDSDGKLVSPDVADRAGAYLCPACRDRLTYKAGPVVSAHFAHRGGTGCTPESALHEGTKLLVAAAVQAWVDGAGDRPVVRRKCGCGHVQDAPLRDGIAAVSVEYRRHVGDRDIVADIALLDARGEPRLLIEILVSHAVDAHKRHALAAANLRWIELEAERVAYPALTWEPRAEGNVPPIACARCAAENVRHNQEIERVATAIAAPASPRGYAVTTYSCWRCEKATLLYFWVGMFDYARPPDPVPRTVQPRYSSVVRRRYWANTCGHCRAMFGNFYVTDELLEQLTIRPGDLTLQAFCDADREAELAALSDAGT
jgi:hypothetical protein